jgi:hypothetical protein
MPAKSNFSKSIFGGQYDEYSFKPSSRVDSYKIEPASIFEHDPVEVGVESLSLHESTKKNKRGNPEIVEGYGKIDYRKISQTPRGTVVEDSNRKVEGHPELIKSSGLTSTSIMDPEHELVFQKSSIADSTFSSASEIMKRGNPIVWKNPVQKGRSQASSTVVDNMMTNVKQSCDNVRAPQDWKSFQRSAEEKQALAQAPIPFEPFSAAKMDNFTFDPTQPYRPKQLDFDGPDENGQVLAPLPNMNLKSFNRTAKCFGLK